MPYFDRFDICEAYYAIEADYNQGGWIVERPSNRRRREATSIQLGRLGFRPAPSFRGYASLSENGREIYKELEAAYGFTTWATYQNPDAMLNEATN